MRCEQESTEEGLVPAVLRVEVSAKLLFISLLNLNRQQRIDYSKFAVWKSDKKSKQINGTNTFTFHVTL